MITQLEMFLTETGLELTLEELVASDIKQANVLEILDEQIELAASEMILPDTETLLEQTVPHLIRLIRAKAQLQGQKTYYHWPEPAEERPAPPDLHNTLEGLLQDYGLWVGACLANSDRGFVVTSDDLRPLVYLSETAAFSELPPRPLAKQFLEIYHPEDWTESKLQELYEVPDATVPESVTIHYMWTEDLNSWDYNWNWLSGKTLFAKPGSPLVFISETLEQADMELIWDEILAMGLSWSEHMDHMGNVNYYLPDGTHVLYTPAG